MGNLKSEIYGLLDQSVGALYTLTSSPSGERLNDRHKSKAQLIEELEALRGELSAFQERVDVCDDKRSEAEKNLQTFLDACSEAALFIDANATVIASNEVTAQRFGLTVEQLVGSSILEALPPEVAARRRKHIAQILHTKEPLHLEDNLGPKTIAVNMYPVFDDKGNVSRVAIWGIDVSQRKRMENEREELIADLKQALSHVKKLGGLLPICASCKKIRDDKGYWNQVERFIHNHSGAQFSHGICPDCAARLYPDYIKKES